ncbi:hypothetical protein TNCV_4925411 [Trichonephila clavipes]|nr:hypothetical protein TNCV_4925411 [Trichonephila clavipes]
MKCHSCPKDSPRGLIECVIEPRHNMNVIMSSHTLSHQLGSALHKSFCSLRLMRAPMHTPIYTGGSNRIPRCLAKLFYRGISNYVNGYVVTTLRTFPFEHALYNYSDKIKFQTI